MVDAVKVAVLVLGRSNDARVPVDQDTGREERAVDVDTLREAVERTIVGRERGDESLVLRQLGGRLAERQDVVLEDGVDNLLEDGAATLFVVVVSLVVLGPQLGLILERRVDAGQSLHVVGRVVVRVLGTLERVIVRREERDPVAILGVLQVLDRVILPLTKVSAQSELPLAILTLRTLTRRL